MIKVKITDTGDVLKFERQKILFKIMTTKSKEEERILQEDLKKINRQIFSR